MSHPGYIVELSHGGFCCGITHIYQLGVPPSNNLDARPKMDHAAWMQWQTRYGHGWNKMVNDDRPAQTALERLEDVIKSIEEGDTVKNDAKLSDGRPLYPNGQVIRRGRPSGIIEVVLISYQKVQWEKELLRLGFRLVNENKNSNSENIVYVYHRNSGTVPTITEMRSKNPKAT